jgi:nicotinamide mononucleotide transporter|tara:strand:+ start:94 stop:705 length:612 start_codon:yes stop_codon:yes gene_type:complete
MDILQVVIDYFNHTWGYVELAGTIASATCVYLAIKQNIWTWFWGVIGVAFLGPLFWHYQLYSDAWLNIAFFLPVQFLGWYWWMKKGPNASDDLPVESMNTSTLVLIVLNILVMAGLTGMYMSNFTDASFPYIDALTTWMSIAAQILMIKKFVESWYLWVAMDIIAIGVYFAKGLVVVSGLYVVFLVLATMGGIAWYKAYQEQK